MYARLSNKKILTTLAGLATGSVAVGTCYYYYKVFMSFTNFYHTEETQLINVC